MPWQGLTFPNACNPSTIEMGVASIIPAVELIPNNISIVRQFADVPLEEDMVKLCC
jgi:hypothetical protein